MAAPARASAGGEGANPRGPHGAGAPFVHVWVEDFVDEADGGRLVRIRVRQLHVHAPHAALIRACGRGDARKRGVVSSCGRRRGGGGARSAGSSTSPLVRRPARRSGAPRRPFRGVKLCCDSPLACSGSRGAATHFLWGRGTRRETQPCCRWPSPPSSRSSACVRGARVRPDRREKRAPRRRTASSRPSRAACWGWTWRRRRRRSRGKPRGGGASSERTAAGSGYRHNRIGTTSRLPPFQLPSRARAASGLATRAPVPPPSRRARWRRRTTRPAAPSALR